MAPPPGACDSAYGHNGRTGSILRTLRRAHFFGEPQRLFDQGLDDERLGHGLDDLALDEDLSLAVAGGDAEVGLARLPRTCLLYTSDAADE